MASRLAVAALLLASRALKVAGRAVGALARELTSIGDALGGGR